jgi:8-oxo-dGTP pyrophosphatase MutT (NUDIX family)
MSGPEAAVTIVRAAAPEPAVLLIRRAEHPADPWSGHWSLPGGRCEPEDGDTLDTALRELAEECGIRLPREASAASLPPRYARRRTPPYMLVAPFVFHIAEQLPARVDPAEAVEAVWVPLTAFADPAQHCLCAVPGVPPNCVFPAIPLPGLPLWGFTYRLLTDWLGLTPPASAAAATAHAVLEFLEAEGRVPVGGTDGRTRRVRGTIPVDRVLAWLAEPRAQVPPVNRVEVRTDAICITGLEFEEYRIGAVTPVSAK